jgi:hypothetical protein
MPVTQPRRYQSNVQIYSPVNVHWWGLPRVSIAQPTPALPLEAHLDRAIGFSPWLGTFIVFLVLQRYRDGVQDGGLNVPPKAFHVPDEFG